MAKPSTVEPQLPVSLAKTMDGLLQLGKGGKGGGGKADGGVNTLNTNDSNTSSSWIDALKANGKWIGYVGAPAKPAVLPPWDARAAPAAAHTPPTSRRAALLVTVAVVVLVNAVLEFQKQMQFRALNAANDEAVVKVRTAAIAASSLAVLHLHATDANARCQFP